jgi:hypothetical protein
MFRSPTVCDLAISTAKAQSRLQGRIDDGIQQGWRLIDRTQECFLMPPKRREDTRLLFKQRTVIPLSRIFQKFVTPQVIDAILDSFVPKCDNKHVAFKVGSRKSKREGAGRNPIMYLPTREHLWQKLCIEIRITGLTYQSTLAWSDPVAFSSSPSPTSSSSSGPTAPLALSPIGVLLSAPFASPADLAEGPTQAVLSDAPPSTGVQRSRQKKGKSVNKGEINGAPSKRSKI